MVAACFEPKVGDLVNVVSRTWPGINKPGGVGKVLKINFQDDIFSVDVDYILGGLDKSVELEFVTAHTFEEENNGRPSRRRRSPAADVAPTSGGKGKQAAKKQPKKSTKKNALKDVSSKANTKSDKKRKLPAAVKPGKAKKAKNVAPESQGNQSMKKNANAPIASKATAAKKVEHKKPKKQSVARKKRQSPPNESAAAMESPPAAASITNASAEDTPSRLSGFLKNVYSDMSKKATTFVQDIIGKTGSQPSSPESIASSLDLKVENERAVRFNAIFSDVIRRKMVETIEIDELRTEVNNVCKDKPFSELELRTQLDRLDKESKVMVTWDTGTIYCL